jgi:hypothetical protein
LLERESKDPVRRGIPDAEVVLNLVDLAAESHNQGGRDVRMVQNSRERPFQLFGIGANRMAAAVAVRKGCNSIDIIG